MDEYLKKAAELSTRARERVRIGGLNRYRRFTRKIRDFFAQAALLEERLNLFPEELGVPRIAIALDRMHTRMVLLFVEGSAAFFTSFAGLTEFPIGTHEMCGLELRGLLAIRQFLDDPRYDGERGQALRVRIDFIASQMRSVLARVPPLPDFGDQPSITADGIYSKPIKLPKRPTTAKPAAAPPAPAPPAQESPPPAPQPSPMPQPSKVRELTLEDLTDEVVKGATIPQTGGV